MRHFLTIFSSLPILWSLLCHNFLIRHQIVLLIIHLLKYKIDYFLQYQKVKMTNKQLIGTGVYAINTEVTLKIPVAQSYLPVQNIKAPSNQLSKDVIYSNDARNARFSLDILTSNGQKQQNIKLELSKEMMNSFFNQIEKIQDEINSYM